MAYPKEIQAIFKRVPKEHHDDLKKLIKFYYELGIEEVQGLVGTIADIKPSEINSYCVVHDSEIDGG